MMRPTDLLSGKRIVLTALSNDDADMLVVWWQDTDFLRLFDSRPAMPRTREQAIEWLEELDNNANTFAFAIRVYDDDALVGYLELDEVDWQHRTCSIGLGIGQEVNRGRGYGEEALRMGLAFAFDELDLHRVEATVFSYNEPSLRLIEKVGFTHEGTFRERLRRDRQRHDMLLFGMLRDEWVRLRR